VLVRGAQQTGPRRAGGRARGRRRWRPTGAHEGRATPDRAGALGAAKADAIGRAPLAPPPSPFTPPAQYPNPPAAPGTQGPQ
jgi:hypothetical protein